MYNRKLVLADGAVFFGNSFGADIEVVADVVFNTGMTGYQEILSDPSYYSQMVVMTYPLIGNYGINKDDFESSIFGASALIVKEYCETPSNWRSEYSLDEVLKENGVPGLCDVDTRALTSKIRDQGEVRGIIVDISVSDEEALNRLNATPLVNNHVEMVSTKESYTVLGKGPRIVLIDFGVKKGIINELKKRECEVIVVPFDMKCEDIVSLRPDGIVLSNGPGNPKDVSDCIGTIRKLQDVFPLFGICLGHQLFGLANGADTVKMKFGHHGCNQPVKDLKSGKVHITSQNHGFQIDEDSLAGTDLELTHIALNDGSVEGVKHKTLNAFTVQYHPEANPGPRDASYLFDKFLENIGGVKNA